MTQKTNYKIPFIALTVLFFLWGFITVVVDAFIPRLKEVFELTYAKAGLVQVAWFLAYLLISIPGGKLVSKLGYKNGIVIGLIIAGLGCLTFIPAAAYRSFQFFLGALFTLASGITILQVAANPFVAVLGDPAKASSRLNLSQAFNSLGTTLGPIFATVFLLSDTIKSSGDLSVMDEVSKNAYYASEASAVQQPFLYIAIFLVTLGIAFRFVKLPTILSSGANRGTYFQALKSKGLRLGALAIFLYVGAEVAIGSFLVSYFLELNMAETILQNNTLRSISSFVLNTFQGTSIDQIDSKAVVGAFVIFYWGGAMIGRFIGSYLTAIFNPSKVLRLFCVGAMTMILLTVSTTGVTAMCTALMVGLFNSIMFPTIFTLSIDTLGELKPEGSGILCTAIFGGAIIPPMFGYLVDISGFSVAFILPALCYAFILFFARKIMHINSIQSI